MSNRKILAVIACGATLACGAGSEKIRLDQVGFASTAHKLAVSLEASATEGILVDAAGKEVFRANLGPSRNWSESGENVKLFDFTAFTKPGTYQVKIGNELSHPVNLQANPFRDVARGAIKAFWYNRCSYALPSAQAGSWARAAGHPDLNVVVHASAASSGRASGSTIRSPGGWYDAGDYGKYVTNAGISTWTLLHLYENNAAYFDTLRLGVPTRGGHRSDLVDEALYNLRWMLTMQDPSDGGVYHKLSTAGFSGFVMPAQDNQTRYVVQKGTGAALNLAATAAFAARLFRDDASLPKFSDSCLAAALSAWRWARAHPAVYFDQAAMNAKFSPSISTGEYGDKKVTDEFAWAASELYLSTGADSFAVAGSLVARMGEAANWSWPGATDVALLGWISLLSHTDRLAGTLASSGATLRTRFLKVADSILGYRNRNPYQIILGGFWWGGNSTFANNGLVLWEAWRATGDTSYRNASLDALDYLLGRNATGYSFVTGFGGKTPMQPHHRPSGADGVAAPVPGFLVGGCNAGQEDKCSNYPSKLGPKSYVDDQNCYAVNEVAINWNAPMAFLAGSWSAFLDGGVATGAIDRDAVARGRLELSVRDGAIQASIFGQIMSRLVVAGPDGRVLASSEGAAAGLPVRVLHSGMVLAKGWTASGGSSTSSIVLP